MIRSVLFVSRCHHPMVSDTVTMATGDDVRLTTTEPERQLLRQSVAR